MDNIERQRELSRERNRRYRENMTEEQKQRKRDKDRASRERRKKARLMENDLLFSEGKRICSVCHNQKSLTEFSKKGVSSSKYNEICDLCLTDRYTSESYSPKEASASWWRKKAYGGNSTYLQRQKRVNGTADIQEFEYKLTGLDLKALYVAQEGRCGYCATSPQT